MLGALAIAAAAALGYLAGQGSSPAPVVFPSSAPMTPPSVSAPTAGLGLVQYEGALDPASTYRGYSYLLVGRSNAAAAAGQPGRSLVYFSGTDVNTRWSTGVPYPEAAAHGWLLKDSAGNLLVNRGYPDNYVGDVGNPAYQQAWLGHVSAFLRSHHNKGVIIDDVLYDLRPLAGTEAATYPTQQDWARAQLSFVAAVGTALRRQGYYVLVNASGYVPDELASDNGTNTIRWWRRLGPYVSGLLDEYYQQISNGDDTSRSAGSAWYQGWDGWERLVATAQSMGKDFVGLMYGAPSDVKQMMYGKASFLLEWNGRGGAFIYDSPSEESGPPMWTGDIGSPAASKQRVGSGWLRRYTHGIALVNPSSGSSQVFELGGSYVLPDGHTVSSVTLSPTTGVVLRRAVSERG